MVSRSLLAALPLFAEYPAGIASHDCMRCYVSRHHRPGTDNRSFSNGYTAQNHRAAADRRPPADASGNAFPIRSGLQGTVGVHGSRISVIDKHDVMPHETFIFDNHAFANKCMAGNFAAPPNDRAALNLDKCAYRRVFANLATIEIDKPVNLNARA